MTNRELTQCPIDEIGAYIDGEMGEAHLTEFETHLAACSRCTQELTQQKQFLCSLNACLSAEADIKPPANFARMVVANAESRVSGLRRPRELSDALFILVGLLLFGLFAMGSNAASPLGGVAIFFDQAAAIGGVVGRFVYSLYLGIAVVIRSLAPQIGGEFAAPIILPAISILFTLIAFQRFSRLRRA